ncbi:MAG: U32 family peptidase [Ruminococcus sp.]|nr:U32 family peptidase [Ruminococcus sp.]
MNGGNLEVLSPAGDRERLEAAVMFGADAVYLAGDMFGMRAAPKNFHENALGEAVRFAHEKGVKVHLACNTLPRNSEIAKFESFIKKADECGVDAVIIADMGLLGLAKKYAPRLPVHMSTQTGIVNFAAAEQLYNMGACRVVLARELSLEEIREIREKTPKELELEAFVHGAMCVSFSGRCLLSQYLTGRDPNRGQCAQPCRWKYSLMEETRPGEYFPIGEDGDGAYILNAKDMCMIDHLDKLSEAGVTSFKIEGRAKSAYYVAVVTNAYRQAVDFLKNNPDNYSLPHIIREEVFKVSHRDYCTGFYFTSPADPEAVVQTYDNGGYIREWDVCAVVTDCTKERIYAEQRNRFFAGDDVEILAPLSPAVRTTAENMLNDEGETIENTCHAAMRFSMENSTGKIFPKGSVIRKQA